MSDCDEVVPEDLSQHFMLEVRLEVSGRRGQRFQVFSVRDGIGLLEDLLAELNAIKARKDYGGP